MMSSPPQPSAPPSIPVAVAVATPGDDHASPHESFPNDNNDTANEAAAAAARQQGTEMIRDHLDAHLSLNPGSSYVSWIATLHPENATVAIDPRFLTPGNPWMVVYQDAKHDLYRKPGGTTAAVEATLEEPASSGTNEVSEGKAYSGFFDLIVGFTILMIAISISFTVEILSLYMYGSSVVCYKIARACSDPRVNIFTALPFGICTLLYQVFRGVDVILLFVSIMIIEILAWVNYFLCALFSLNCGVGRGAHQRTRRLAHLTRWAFRRKFGDWEPKRLLVGTGCDGSGHEVAGGSLTTPDRDDGDEEKAPRIPATVAPILEKEQMYDN